MKRMRELVFSRRTGILVVALGLAVMGFGAHRGELAVIFTKATNICLECVGIG